MPVLQCANGKFRIGSGPCVYTSQASADRAYAAYLARQGKGDGMKKNLEQTAEKAGLSIVTISTPEAEAIAKGGAALNSLRDHLVKDARLFAGTVVDMAGEFGTATSPKSTLSKLLAAKRGVELLIKHAPDEMKGVVPLSNNLSGLLTKELPATFAQLEKSAKAVDDDTGGAELLGLSATAQTLFETVFAGTDDLHASGLNKERLVEIHGSVAKAMDHRGIPWNTGTELDQATETARSYSQKGESPPTEKSDVVTLGAALDHVRKGAILKGAQVSFVGNIAKGETDGDIEVMIGGPVDAESLVIMHDALRKMFPPELAKRLTFKEYDGTAVEAVPLFDVGLQPVEKVRPAKIEKGDDRQAQIRKAFKHFANPIRIHKVEGQEESRYALGVVLEPNDGADGEDVDPDADNDIYSEEEIELAAWKFMEQYQNIGDVHTWLINDQIKIRESYIARAEFEINGERVKKGSWLLGIHVKDDDKWEGVQNGTYNAFSIGGSAIRTPVVDDSTKEG